MRSVVLRLLDNVYTVTCPQMCFQLVILEQKLLARAYKDRWVQEEKYCNSPLETAWKKTMTAVEVFCYR